MKHHKLPFNISLERKYNEINIDQFLPDWDTFKNQRKDRLIAVNNDLHIEMGKFNSFDLTISEIIDIGMRYALAKHEFRKLTAQIIEIKNQR